MVILSDRLSDIAHKGEVVDRYFNPGNLFSEVHLVLTNDDDPPRAPVQRMVGDAELHLHNLIFPSFKRSFGWQEQRIRMALNKGVHLAEVVRPFIVRTINNFVEGVTAVAIKEALGIPFITSLHGVWDVDDLGSLRDRIIHRFRTKLERRTLESSDAVIAVYRSIERYAVDNGARRVEVLYNVVAGERINPKDDYRLSNPPRLITINRQVQEKNPENIIRAVGNMECEYLVVGDGPLHEHLKAVAARDAHVARVEFRRAVPNDELCELLPEFDLMVSHCDYLGMPKSVIEASLAGLPTIMNVRKGGPVPDYDGDWVELTENSPREYAERIRNLLEDEELRSTLGLRARAHANKHFDAATMEKKTVELYLDILGLGRDMSIRS